jgi:hypothetical protein
MDDEDTYTTVIVWGLTDDQYTGLAGYLNDAGLTDWEAEDGN